MINSNPVIGCHLGGHMIECILICGLDSPEDMHPLCGDHCPVEPVVTGLD